MLKQRQCGENKWKITISNVKYDKGNIAKWQVKYKLVEDEHWNTTEDYDFFVYKSGTYIIKLVNNDVESEKKQIKLVIEKENYISKTEPYVGYYADIEGDGIVDGVIYADLAIGNTKSGQWINLDGKYNIPVETGLKDYRISQKNYEGIFGINDVIQPIEGKNGKDRFYVMALENLGEYYNRYIWYHEAYGYMEDYATATSLEFGKGRTNTATMIEKWNTKSYGEQDTNPYYKDVWGQITEKVAKGWFVPSRAEWAAFAEELGVTEKDYTSLGLSNLYWSSSQYDTGFAWRADLGSGISYTSVDADQYVRLSMIF